MRLHSLTLEAFGPFVEPQRIDFDALGAHGLFLVHGPTGAGKTSILDAVCFALFADVPGDRQPRGLRSDLAAPGTPAVVSVEFTAGGRRLHVTRHAEHQRPKKRGPGSVTVHSTVVLRERCGGQWRVVSTRIDETADVIRDLLGLGLAQFHRVALLPQGDFAAFLKASPEERRELLERLFDVAQFTDLERWLADQRRALTQRATVEGHLLEVHLARLTEVLAGVPAPVIAAELPEGGALGQLPLSSWPTLAPRLLEQVEGWSAQALTAHGAAEHAEREAQQLLDQATERARLRGRGERAVAALTALDAAAPEVDLLRLRVAAAERASAAGGELRAFIAAQHQHQQHTQVLADALAPLGHADRAVLGALSGPARDRTLGALRERLEASAEPLERAEHALDDAARDRAEWVTAEAALAIAVQGRGAAAADLARWQESVRSARASVDELHALAALRAARTARRELLERWAGLRAEHARAEREYAGADRAVQAARRAHLDAREALLQIQQARLEDLAAQLAESLCPGQACPVCGSVEHPEPRATGAQWSPDQLAAAEAALDLANRRVEEVSAQLTRRQTMRDTRAGDLESLREQLELPARGAIDDDRLVQDALAAERRCLAADTALAAARTTLDSADARESERARLLGVCDQDLAAARTRADDSAQRHQRSLDAASDALREHRQACPCRTGPTDASLITAGPVRGSLPAHALTGKGAGRVGGQCAGAVDDLAGELGNLAGELTQVLAQSRAQHAALTQVVRTAQRAAEESDRSALRMEQAQAALTRAMTGQGFADPEELAAAVMTPQEMLAARDQLRQHDTERAVHTATLAEPAVASARLAPDPTDPQVAAQDHARARAALTAAARTAAETGRTAADVAATLRAVVSQAAVVEPVLVQSAEIGELAELVAGTGSNNTLRMRLSAFVLAARLERVVELANERLARMGQGRFRLGHDDARAARGARSGLGLVVHDEWSGLPREPASLSGGESFMTSLALALGLADAIRESSGGRELQTLFVDEGFGSLDEDSLEAVMSVLDSLRDGGRAVGVVSHLGDLRDRIPMRLQVHKSPHGSRVSMRAEQPAA